MADLEEPVSAAASAAEWATAAYVWAHTRDGGQGEYQKEQKEKSFLLTTEAFGRPKNDEKSSFLSLSDFADLGIRTLLRGPASKYQSVDSNDLPAEKSAKRNPGRPKNKGETLAPAEKSASLPDSGLAVVMKNHQNRLPNPQKPKAKTKPVMKNHHPLTAD